MSLAQQSQTWFPTHVQVTVFQAKGLRSKGKAGTNDAYAFIQLGKEKYSTTVAEKSLAPLWKEEATFEVPLLHNDNQDRCTVRVIVMHRALVGMDKFLGQLDLNLWELHQNKGRKNLQWYPLKSKPGKKQKERGQIEVEVKFMRNNMTASMFDLSMKEKSRSPFGKLKDKIKGKRQDGFPDTASAIVPSTNQYGDDSDDEISSEGGKKKSKLKNLFSKPGLKKNSSISQSMSVLPTLPPSPSQRTVLKPGDFSSDFSQAQGSPVSERRFPHIPVIMTHKRTASADTKQWNQTMPGNKKDGLSFFTGLKSKNDPTTRSNLCINGNHVYMEESESKSDSSKDSSLTNSPQISRKTPLYASAENLSYKASKEPINPFDNTPEKGITFSVSSSNLKSLEQNPTQSSQVEEPRPKTPPLPSDIPKEVKENKKPESKKSSLLALVTGRKDTPKTEPIAEVPSKKEEPKAFNSQQPVGVQTKKSSLNPFNEDRVEEKKPEPLPTERSTKTSAVKPRLDVSSEAETKARLPSSPLSDSSSLAASLSGGQDAATPKTDLHESSNTSPSMYSSNSLAKDSSLPESPTLSEGATESTTDDDKPSLPLFWRSGTASNKPPEPKEVNVVAPFTEKNKGKKTYVKSLLDQLKGKSTNKNDENVVDEDLVRGILPALHDTSPISEEPPFFPENSFNAGNGGKLFTPHIDHKDHIVSTEIKEDPHAHIKDVPKPTPRVQSVPKKEEPEDVKSEPPKPAPRSARSNKTLGSVSDGTSVQPIQPKERSPTDCVIDKVSGVGASPIDSQVQSGQVVANIKMASPFIEEFSYRLDELPVIPENPEGTSDDEQLDVKIDESHRSGPYSSKKADSDSGTYKEEVSVALSEMSSLPSADKVKENASDKADIFDSKVKNERSDSAKQQPPEILSSPNTYPSSSPLSSGSLPTDKPSPPRAESPTLPTIDGSDKVESSGKKKLLRAWVSPSETHPIPTVQSGGTVSSRQRTNPVKPLNTTQNKTMSNFPQPIKGNENVQNSINTKKYDQSDPASAYTQLTHDELIQIVLKQKETITKKEAHVKELEEYIDNLLVRVMEETPNILRSGPQFLKAGKI
ncbi:rab11 family-interacting protein 1 [Pseudophryne corroboree]|uniref:rab11 family-interacting protein 1 n=1 Tax=Pseudophryne corroboree TaxID=495146 RepID=UPI0030813A45